MEMATKNLIVLFESKSIYKYLLHNFHICFISWDILNQKIELFAILDICRYAWYVISSGVTEFYFSYKTMSNKNPLPHVRLQILTRT